jgi:hypothetical protein
MEKSNWTVTYSNPAGKQYRKLPEKMQAIITRLKKEIEITGPIRKNWAHFSGLSGKNLPKNSYHCHLNAGRPTYVACWSFEKKIKSVEIFYVGTHENAPY